jgi:heterotetrameric sarcosine oxidase gamma subunit
MSDTPAITESSDFTLVHIATRGNPHEIAQSLSAALGIDITAEPGPVAHGPGDLRVMWFGPGRWLIHAPERDWAMDKIPGAAITDLSDSRRIFRWSGEAAVRQLAQSCPLDLRESSMPVGSSALTQFDRFTILLYRSGATEFDVYVDRSYADSMPGSELIERGP